MRFRFGTDDGLRVIAAWGGTQSPQGFLFAANWRSLVRMRARRATRQCAAFATFYLALSLLASLSALAQSQPPAGYPSEIRETEGPTSGIWIWNNTKGQYDAAWNNGAVAAITVKSFTPQSVVLSRTDTTGTSANLTAVYTGQIASEGCSIIYGQATWTWLGHFAQPPTGAWKAGWVVSAAGNSAAPCPQPAVNDILIYTFKGQLVHSGVIEKIDSRTGCTGRPVAVISRINSKWGPWGLYQHDPLDVPNNYGDWAVYHSPRGSNLLYTLKQTVGPFWTVHYVTDRGVQVEVSFLDQDRLAILQYFADLLVGQGVPLGPSVPTITQASTVINRWPWWANPTGSPQGSHLYDKLQPLANPSLAYDCHGYTFANGAVVVNNNSVGAILKQNDYHPLPAYDTKMVLHTGPEP
jgi:hypothetical protein